MFFIVTLVLAIIPLALADSISPSRFIWPNSTIPSSLLSVSASSSVLPSPPSSSLAAPSSTTPLLLPSLAVLLSSSHSSSLIPAYSPSISSNLLTSSVSLAPSSTAARLNPSSSALSSLHLSPILSASTNSTPSALAISAALPSITTSNSSARLSSSLQLPSLDESRTEPLSPTLSTPPIQFSSTNSTRSGASNASVSTSTNSSACVAFCTHSWPAVTTWKWTTVDTKATVIWTATATITETVLLMLNGRENVTRTSTIGASSSSTSWQTALTATQFDGSPLMHDGAPLVLTFPNNYVDYDSYYKVKKAGLSAVPIVPTKGRCETTTKFSLLSHPSLPQPAPTPVSAMPGQVWGLVVMIGDGSNDPNGFFKNQFPFEAAFQLCYPFAVDGGSEPPGPGALVSVESLTTVTQTIAIHTSSTSSDTIAAGTNAIIVNPPAVATSTKISTSGNPTFTTHGLAGSSPEDPTQATDGSTLKPEQTDPPANGPTESTSDNTTPKAAALPPLVIDNKTLNPLPSANSPEYFVSGKTLSLQGSITLGSDASQTIVGLATDAVGNTLLNVGGQMSTIPNPVVAPALLVVAGTTLVPIPGASDAFSITSTTLTLGGSVTLGVGIASTTVLALSTDSAGHTVIVFNGQSSTLSGPSITPAPNLVFLGTTIAANAPSSNNQGFVVSGQTLTVGGVITLGSGPSATTLALQTDAAGHTIVVSNGQSSEIPATTDGVASLIIGGQTLTAATASNNDVGYVVDGQTLTLGGTIILGSGPSATTLALQTDSSGQHTFIVSNGHSSEIAAPAPTAGALTIDGSVVSATSLSAGGIGFVISGQTLTQGGSITVLGTVFTLTTDVSGHTVLASNGHTSTLPSQTTAGPLNIDGQTIMPTSLPSGAGVGYIIDGQTLKLGGSVIVSGTAFTLTTDPEGHTVLVTNGQTSTVADANTASTTGGMISLGSSRQTGPIATSTFSGSEKSLGSKRIDGRSVLRVSCIIFLIFGTFFAISG